MIYVERQNINLCDRIKYVGVQAAHWCEMAAMRWAKSEAWLLAPQRLR